ncbi:MAG: dephospho-CoA kinase [Desulfobacterales bacterium PC51MH44]|nr:MAG: dephospho-CoA kinase [Desulfobacterales bacterium PC51MH44]
MVKTVLNVLKVAVTGGAGSGKTTVCKRLKELGVKVISSDALAREAVAKGSPAYKNIVNYFGEKVLISDGNINRQLLRRTIINDDVARLALERFIHPEISKLMQRKTAKAEEDGDRVVLIEVPLLFELGLEGQFDVVVVVSTDFEVRVKRLMDRDNISREEAENLLNVQMPNNDKVERAEFVLTNEGSKEQLKKSVDLFYKKFLQKYTKKIESP